MDSVRADRASPGPLRHLPRTARVRSATSTMPACPPSTCRRGAPPFPAPPARPTDAPTPSPPSPPRPPSAYPPHGGQDPAARRVPREPAFVLPPGRRPHLGEIVVSVERAIAQAAQGRGGAAGVARWGPAAQRGLLLPRGG